MNTTEKEWWEDYERLNSALEPYYARIHAKMDDKLKWIKPPTEAEQVLFDLWYFYSAALVNNGDVFSYMHYMIEHKKAFQAIDAKGCLSAMKKLMPYYKEQQKLKSDEDKHEYWRRTKEERYPAECESEEPNAFARLLLKYAQEQLGGLRLFEP